MADKDAERFETQYFVDLEMTIPAKVGDPVAVLVPANMVPPSRWPLGSDNTRADELADRL